MVCVLCQCPTIFNLGEFQNLMEGRLTKYMVWKSFLIVYIRLIVLSVLHIILFASLSPTIPPRLPFLSIVPSSQGGVSSGLLWAPSTCKKCWSGMFTFQTTFQLSCALVPLIFNLQTKIWITSSVNRMCIPQKNNSAKFSKIDHISTL